MSQPVCLAGGKFATSVVPLLPILVSELEAWLAKLKAAGFSDSDIEFLYQTISFGIFDILYILILVVV